MREVCNSRNVTGFYMTRLPEFLHQPGTRKWLAGLILLAAAGGGYWYFSGGGPSAPRRAAAPVRTAQVVRRDMPVVEHTLGTVVANAMVQITARVQGTLEEVHFTEGQYVKKGDV